MKNIILRILFGCILKRVIIDKKRKPENLFDIVIRKFHIPTENINFLEIYDDDGHVYERDTLVCPEEDKIFYIRYKCNTSIWKNCNWKKWLQKEEKMMIKKAKKSVPVRRENCFWGKYPITKKTKKNLAEKKILHGKIKKTKPIQNNLKKKISALGKIIRI